MNAADDLFQRGFAFFQAGKHVDAERCFKKALRADPKHVGALNVLGILMMQRQQFAEAEHCIRTALSLNGASDVSYYNHGIVLKELKRPQEAYEQFSQALAINPVVPETWNNRGTALNDLKRYDQAVADFDKALSLKSDYAEAVCNKGKALAELRRHEDAFAAYNRALSLKPDLAEAWLGIGNLFYERKRFDNALIGYDKAWSLKPSLPYLQGYRLQAKMGLCDWSNFERECSDLASGVRQGRLVAEATLGITMPFSAADQLKCAELYAKDRYASQARLWQGESYAHERIRVAYLSADFRDHPVARLLGGLIEQHDRERFETIGVSFGPDDRSEFRARLESGFDQFVDVRLQSDLETARLLRDREVDIAVDLMGFTDGSRPAILAYRPAPVQVNYLGYAGTTGAEHMDYIVADRFVIPDDQRRHYSEQVVHLPDTFMGHDRKRRIAEDALSRAQAGVPESGFVFCSFNNHYKITPPIFAVWMRLLQAVDSSVLWLAATSEAAMRNLRREAEGRGVRGDRIVFAPRVERADVHLARYRLADLFLDTLPYNAHATTGDALWAGLPVLTCAGSTFAGRVAGSLLTAVGLPELITDSLEHYEATALKLARDPELLASLREKLKSNQSTCPLFDIERFTRHMEAAYQGMHDRQRQGGRPKGFAVPA